VLRAGRLGGELNVLEGQVWLTRNGGLGVDSGRRVGLRVWTDVGDQAGELIVAISVSSEMAVPDAPPANGL